MAWLDERVWCHRKFTDIPDRAFRVWINGIAYSSGLSTKGRLTPGQQKLIGATPRVRAALVDARLWEQDGADILIHDWDEHNGKRDARREADRERKRIARNVLRRVQSNGTSAGLSAGRSKGQSRGASTGTARVEGSEGSEGSDVREEVKNTSSRGRPRDLLWEALVAQFGDPLTPNERKRLNGVCGQLRSAHATPEQVPAAVQAWGREFPEATLTDTALAKHWTRLVRSVRLADPEQRLLERARQRGDL